MAIYSPELSGGTTTRFWMRVGLDRFLRYACDTIELILAASHSSVSSCVEEMSIVICLGNGLASIMCTTKCVMDGSVEASNMQ
jgi:hypothetical protein